MTNWAIPLTVQVSEQSNTEPAQNTELTRTEPLVSPQTNMIIGFLVVVALAYMLMQN